MPRHILVAEDDEAARALLVNFLQKRGFKVTAVADGEAAIGAIGGVFDAVILDVMMPKRTGLDVLRAVRQRGLTVPIIMATALSGPHDIVTALEAGADDYVTKPYSFPVLLARLEARMRTRSAEPPPLPGKQRFKTRPPPTEEGLLARLKAKFGRQPPRALELHPGTVLGDRYEIEGPLGSGAYGTVYKARHVDLNQAVAVKVLTRLGPYGTAEALRREAQRACQVRHSNAVRVFDFGLMAPGSAFLVMELLDGPTLSVALERDGALTPHAGFGAVRGVLGALAVMHDSGLVHRDVKPQNVLMHNENGRAIPKLIDFGTALGTDEPDDGELLGSPAYLSPERIRGEEYDGRSDVYSCGVMLYRLLTSALPIPGDELDFKTIATWHLTGQVRPPSQLRSTLPKGTDELSLKLLARNPNARPEAREAEQLVHALMAT